MKPLNNPLGCSRAPGGRAPWLGPCLLLAPVYSPASVEREAEAPQDCKPRRGLGESYGALIAANEDA